MFTSLSLSHCQSVKQLCTQSVTVQSVTVQSVTVQSVAVQTDSVINQTLCICNVLVLNIYFSKSF